MARTENHELIKKKKSSNTTKKEIIEILANQWATLCEEEKQVWESRAEELTSQQQHFKSNIRTDQRDKKSK